MFYCWIRNWFRDWWLAYLLGNCLTMNVGVIDKSSIQVLVWFREETSHYLKDIFCPKGALWNTTRNIIPVYWKIRVSYTTQKNLRAAMLKSSYMFRNAQRFLCLTLYERKYAVCLHIRLGLTGGIHISNAMLDDVMAWKLLDSPCPLSICIYMYTCVCTELSNIHW